MAPSRAHNLSLVFCLCASSLAMAEPSRVCELAAKRGGLDQYVVHVDPDKDGSRTIKADIDHDGSSDEMRWVDSDTSTLTLTLSSNSKSFSLEQQRLYVVKLESNYYVIATRIESELGPWYRDVFAVTQKGITTLCSFEGKGQAPENH